MRALCSLLIVLGLFVSLEAAVTVSNLRVEYLRNPLGVMPNPRFSWNLLDQSNTRGQAQTAYQIMVSSTGAQSWDSGKITSAKSYLIRYSGPALSYSTRFIWKVRVWDAAGQPSAWSPEATFVTGIQSWSNATWITGGDANNQLRTEFTLPATATTGVVHVSGLGYFELHCNGRKVSEHMLDVGWTDYNQRVYYVTHDITEHVMHRTKNVFAVTLGNSWFACAGQQPGCMNTPPQLLLTANFYAADGSFVSQVSSNTMSWKTSPGPITYNSLYKGETYDARLETPGWTDNGFNDAGWKAPSRASFVPPKISSQLFEPIRRLQTFPPRYVSEPRPGMFVVDFGQNMAGLVEITIRNCQPGQNITLRHGELLMHPPYGEADGTIYYGNLRSAKATDKYTCRGSSDGIERYTPTFTQHGFRFVEVTGLTEILSEDDIIAHEMHTAVEQIGEVACTDPLLNKIQHNVVWGQKSNLMSVPTDCPQRDERRGWMGDAALTCEEAAFNFDMSAMFTNWLNIIRDDQHADGSVTNYVPSLGDKGPGAPNWQTAYPSILSVMYNFRGDADLVHDHWTSLNAYMAFFDNQYKKTGLKNFFTGFGDWVPPPPAPASDLHLVAAFSYLRDLQLFADLATAVEEHGIAAEVKGRLKALKDEFNTAFYNPTKKVYGSGLQTEISMGLWIDAVPPADKRAVLKNLINDIIVTHDIHPTTGILGWKYMLETLTTNGRSDVGVLVNQQDTYPSFGYMIQGAGNAEPATTVWELWDSDREGPGMNSRNHIMFGTVGSWLYKAFLGFVPGPKTIAVGPDASIVNTNNITSAEGKTITAFGTVQVGWYVAGSDLCGEGDEGETVTVTCPSGAVISKVSAFYGTPSGSCLIGFKAGSCNSPNSNTAVSKLCMGKTTCSVPVSNDFFGGDPCYGTAKHLAVTVGCSSATNNPTFHLTVTLPPGQNYTSVSVPIVPNLNQNPNNIQIREGNQLVWSQGKFISGVAGVLDGAFNSAMNAVVIHVNSGVYSFTSVGS